MLPWIIYAAVGRLVIFLAQQFPLPPKLEGNWFFGKLHRCDLCLGCYIFPTLAYLFHMNLFSDFFYVMIVSEILTGFITSFLVHLVVLGWHEKFDVVIV